MLEPELRQELKDLINEVLDEREHERKLNGPYAVSYTHLTLPTIYSV